MATPLSYPSCRPVLARPERSWRGSRRVGSSPLRSAGCGRLPNRINTLAWVAKALDRHLVLSIPADVPETSIDAVRSPETASEKLTESSRTSGKQWGTAGNTGQVGGALTSGFACFPWSADEPQRAHNPKVAGSNPAPATRTPGQKGRISVRPFAALRDLPEISHQLTDSGGEACSSGRRTATFGLVARRASASGALAAIVGASA
jgi:hypothetical protein